ncbi:MAG: biotin/lipoate A/B protein ligase family protein [Candidatus Nanohaloarchaea archaeon]
MDREWRVVTHECSPAMHIALDQVLTERVASGGAPPTLRFWEWPTRSVIIGRFQAVRDEVYMDMADEYDVDVVRRTTGGGAMFTEPGRAVTYSLTLPQDAVTDDIVASYRDLEDWSIAALNDIGVDASHQPVNDIVSGGRKVGGSAQARRDGAVLHHTMLAYDIDIPTMLKVLKVGEEKVSDKAIESAASRVAPITDHVDLPRSTVVDRMIEEFSQGRSVRSGALTDAEIGAAADRVADRFGTDDWLYHVDREIEDLER